MEWEIGKVPYRPDLGMCSGILPSAGGFTGTHDSGQGPRGLRRVLRAQGGRGDAAAPVIQGTAVRGLEHTSPNTIHCPFSRLPLEIRKMYKE
jgi:hypothetical protein